jgi:hypothetical protein
MKLNPNLIKLLMSSSGNENQNTKVGSLYNVTLFNNAVDGLMYIRIDIPERVPWK